MSPLARDAASANFHFSCLSEVQEHFARQRQRAQQRANAYKDGAGGRMSKHERERIIAVAQAEARVYDDCWAMLGQIDVEFAYRNAGRVPEGICLVCGEEQPERPIYCEYRKTFDNGDQPNVTVECDSAATFRVHYEDGPEGGTLCCGQHLSSILDEYGPANVTPLTSG